MALIESKLLVALRGKNVPNVEAYFEDGYDTEALDDEDFDATHSPPQPTHEEMMERVFDEFIAKMREVLPFTRDADDDIYVGLWADQDTFTIPQSFFDFIAETKIKVVFDLND